MPRPHRLNIPGYPYHVVQRGNNRGACFFAERDYVFYLKCVERAAQKFECAVHAYALMTNHVHLLLTPAHKDSLQKLMQSVGKRYVYYINKRYDRTGRLWEGRYRPFIVEEDSYLLACYRYIELNPVRAGLAIAPEHYPWSSFAANGLGRRNSLVSPHETYLALSAAPEKRPQEYRLLFAEDDQLPIDELIECRTSEVRVIGSRRFRSKIETLTGQELEPGKRGRPRIAENVNRNEFRGLER